MTARAFTKHAEQRARDRSIPEIAVWLLDHCGVREPAGGGTERIYFDKRAWREVERLLGPWRLNKMEQLRRVYSVVSAEGAVVTVAYKDQ